MRHYLAVDLLGNTDNEDLWVALEGATGQPVRGLMDGWIFSGGHPLVVAGIDDAGALRLDQVPFRYDGADDGSGTLPATLLSSRFFGFQLCKMGAIKCSTHNDCPAPATAGAPIRLRDPEKVGDCLL